MTIEELVEGLSELARDYNYDSCCSKIGNAEGHNKADYLLLEFINDQRVTDAFESVEKWYS